MMSEEERRAMGRARRLVFVNLANGVPAEKIGVDLRLSALEIEQARAFVARKINEHLVLRRQPPIDCGDVRAMRWNRLALLVVLARMGDLDLSTTIHLMHKPDGTTREVSIGRLTMQAMDHPEMIQGAQARMQEAYR